MPIIEEAQQYIEVIAAADPGLEAGGAALGTPFSTIYEQAAEQFGHSSAQAKRRMKPLRDAGFFVSVPGRRGAPARARLTTRGIQARERIQERSAR